MELASMLAGERFTDRPRSVSPVIGAFLRAYNDRLDDERRQDLYEYAARVVGTSTSRRIERARSERCCEWVAATGGRVPLRIRIGRSSSAGAVAGRWATDPGTATGHRAALEFVDRLIGIGRSSPAPAPAVLEKPAPRRIPGPVAGWEA
jgi:hypothetical protein